MRSRFVLIFLVVFAAGVVGCKSTEDKVCDHLTSTLKIDEGRYTLEECAKDVERLKKECKNPNDVLECALAAADEEAAGKCFLKCEPAEAKN